MFVPLTLVNKGLIIAYVLLYWTTCLEKAAVCFWLNRIDKKTVTYRKGYKVLFCCSGHKYSSCSKVYKKVHNGTKIVPKCLGKQLRAAYLPLLCTDESWVSSPIPDTYVQSKFTSICHSPGDPVPAPSKTGPKRSEIRSKGPLGKQWTQRLPSLIMAYLLLGQLRFILWIQQSKYFLISN